MTSFDVERGRASVWGFAAFAALSVAALVGISWLGREGFFWHDECDFLHHRSFADPVGLLVPHNDHAVALPAAAYRLVHGIAGVDSYLPYLALLQLAHVGTAAGLFAVVRRHSEVLGVGAAALFLFLGTGADNIFWAFQITFVGSTAFGVWGLWAVDHRRWRLASLLLTCSVFCSMVGAAFIVAAGAYALAERDRRGIWLAVPLGLLAGWWATFVMGTTRPAEWAVYEYGSPSDPQSWMAVPAYVFEATFRSLAAVTGVGIGIAFIAVIIGPIAAIVAWLQGWRPSALQSAAVTGLLAFFVMAGVIRAADAVDIRPRFIYVGAVFLLLLVPRLPRHPLMISGAIVLFALGIVTNILALPVAAAEWAERATGPLACVP